mgnify:CR=1 FL=1
MKLKVIDKHAGIRACEERIAKIMSGDLPQPDTTLRPLAPRAENPNTWAAIIRDELSQEGITGVSARREIIQRVKAFARAGLPWAVQFLADREEGRPHQQVDLTGKDGGPLTVSIVRFGGDVVTDEYNATP